MQVHDPLVSAADAEHEYGIALSPFEALRPADAVILAVAHSHYIDEGWPLITRLLKGGKGFVLDVKSKLDRGIKPNDVELWRL